MPVRRHRSPPRLDSSRRHRLHDCGSRARDVAKRQARRDGDLRSSTATIRSKITVAAAVSAEHERAPSGAPHRETLWISDQRAHGGDHQHSRERRADFRSDERTLKKTTATSTNFRADDSGYCFRRRHERSPLWCVRSLRSRAYRRTTARRGWPDLDRTTRGEPGSWPTGVGHTVGDSGGEQRLQRGEQRYRERRGEQRAHSIERYGRERRARQ